MFLRDIDRLLRDHDRRWRLGMLAVFMLSALQSVAVVLRPLPIRALIEPPGTDSIFGTIEQATSAVLPRLWFYVGLVVLIEVSILVLRVAAEIRTASLTERIIRSIRGRIAENLLRGDYRVVSAAGPGAVIAAASGDVESVQRLLREALVHAGVATLQLALMLVIILFVEGWLFWILLIEIIGLAVAIFVYANWRKRRYLEKMDVDAHLLGLLSTLQQKNLDARFTGLGSVFLSRATALARRLFAMNMVLWRRAGVYYSATEFTIGVSAALCLVLLYATSPGGAPPIGKFLVFTYYAVLIFPCLQQIGEAWPMINDARAALVRIGANTAPQARRTGARQKHQVPEVPAGFGDIVFDEVTVTGERGETLLDRLSFRLQPGEKLGLFGDSGSGKTTILLTLLGINRPSGGRATIAGHDLAALSLAERKRFFYYARAYPAFFPATVYDNIALHGRPSEDAFAEMLDRVHFGGRLALEPAGARTLIGDKGEPFSGGEQQRIAIARCLMSPQPCLILDEALNSLDEANELAILRCLMTDFPEKTMIVVSHRGSARSLFPFRLEMAKGGHGTLIRP
ncbi:MAG: ABC transporter ATP-binding protein [Alphaproteobacteria bacterium]|nr:ABC transporter ATP-binding protein [Alphaproteobacteria bacterium]